MNKELKILFICGSIEYGKDGVGDYTRRLAGELIRLGHVCSILALMDKFVKEVTVEQQIEADVFIKCLRIPYSNGYIFNCKESKSWVDEFNPLIISLQFVPFSFQSKGLPFGLLILIKKLTSNRNLHIMFHELWVWKRYKYDIKYILWSNLQRCLIYNLLIVLNPKFITTQTNLYELAIQKLGFRVEMIPLFSNISESKEYEKKTIYALNYDKNKEKKITFVIFGEIQFGAPVDSFSKELYYWGKLNNTVINIVFLGKNGIYKSNWITICKRNGLFVQDLGWQPSEVVAKILYHSDAGIATTPYLVIQKSGSVAAMSNFGLPIICVARDWKPKGYEGLSYSEVFEYRSGILKNFLDNIGKWKTNKNTVENVALKYISAFT